MKKRSCLLMFLAILHSMASWCAMPDGYTFYTTTNDVSTAFTALPTAYRCAIGIAWNSTQRTSSSMPAEIGAGIPTDYQGAFVIPSFLKDQAYSVTEIGYKAFYKCKGITAVAIPYSITYIDYFAFEDCISLKKVVIPGSVITIDELSFGLCSSLESVILNEGTTTIGNQAFLACSSLKTIDIPASVTKIGTKAFGGAQVNHNDYGYGSYEGCDNLTKVIVHWDTPITISEGTFSNAANCTLFVPKGKVETYANADIWKDFKEIKEYSPIIDFADASVKSICVNRWDTDGDGELSEDEAAVVTDIGTIFRKKAITSFNELKYFTGLTTIGSEAFEKCYSLTSIVVPQNITTISNQAFKECTSLTAINIPRKVTSIGSRAFESCNSLTKVIVEDIASWCSLTCYDNPLGQAHHLYCEDNREITDLVIPDGVATIGNSAFAYCTSLTSVTMPNSLATIGTSAFAQCTSLESINVPNGVKNIQSNAFSGCSSLTTITFPASVNSIGGALFTGCSSLTTISIDNNNATYESPYGSLAIIDKTTNTLVAGFEKTVIPNGVISIGQSAFSNCNMLTNIVIPNSVTSIGQSAFQNCSGLCSIVFPSNLESIGNTAFYHCTSLNSVMISPNVQSIGKSAFEGCNGLKTLIINSPASIGEKAFYGCNNLRSIMLSNVKSIGASAFEGLAALSSINLPNSITSIGGLAFQNCTNLSSIVIPKSVTSVGGSVFYGCTGLESATIEGTTIGYQQFYGCKSLESIILSDNVTSIGNNAFIGCTSLTSVNIPLSVSSIGSAAFDNCENLILVVSENENPTNINDAAFYGISSNARLQVPVGTKSKYQAITGWSKYFKEIVDDGNTPEVLTLTIQVDGLGTVNYDGVSLRNKVYKINIIEGNSAALSFKADNASGLKSVKVNNVDVTSNLANNQYTTNAITSNSIIEVKFEYPVLTDGQTFRESYSYGSITYRVISVNDKTCEVYSAYSDEDDGDFIIPASIYGYRVIGIYNYAFSDEDDMESITIPPTITYIGNGAFEDGGTVSDVYISDLEAWCNILFSDGYSAPSYANLWLNGKIITDLIIPNSIIKINNYAFDGCSCICSVVIHEGVNEIGERSFAGCSLSSVTMMATTPIAINATSFPNRNNATLYVRKGCKAAYEAADYWKEFKEIVELPAPSPIIAFADANVKALCVANWDTDGDGELSEAEAAAVTNLRNVFKEKQIITSFNELQYFSGLTSIQEGAFYGCSNLSSVTIPNTVTSIGSAAFQRCSSLTSIIVPSNVTSIESWAFTDSGLSTVIISNGVTSIGIYAFYDTHLQSLSIPSSVNNIGVAAFGYCQELSSITVESGNEKYHSNDCNAIIEWESNTLIAGCINTKIPFGVEKIANVAFRGCKMTGIEIPSSVTAIGAYAFNWCDKLASITIPSSVSSIGESAFYGCDCLSSVKVEMESPIIIEHYTFSNCANATLYVPYGSKSAYEAADYWKDFKEIVEIDNRSEQTLALEELPVLTYGDGTYQLPVETEQGLPLSWGIISDHSVVSFPDFNDWRLVIDGAGAATVTATQAGNNDYKPFSREFTLTVNKAALTIIADDKTKREGEENPPLTVSYDGFKYNDDASALTAQPTVSTTATKESPTGSYPITSSGAASNNYDFTYVEGTLTVLEKHEPEPVEVTDISQMNYVIYIEPMEVRTGTQATISLKMKNTAEIRAFQFDLYLPEGVTAVKSAKGKIQGFLSAGRLPDEDEHTLSFSEQPDGAIRFLCGSEYDETFTGNDGEIATLLVNIADNIADGEYPVQLKGMKLTETDISKYYETALVQSKLTISTYVIGDINGDGVVDVSDYTGVANHIHNNTPAGFNAKAADVDESGGIDVSDYTGIANIIHTGSIYGNNSNARMMVREPRKVNTDLSSKDNVIYVKPLAALAGSQATISVKMKNTAEIRSFQFDLQLPDGVTVVKSAKGKIQGSLSASRLPEEDEHTLSFSEHEGNVIRFLCGSLSDETFTGNDGEIATLQVDVAANVEAEDHTVYLRNMKLSESDISKFYQTEELGTTLAVAPEGSARGDANGDKSVSVTDIAVVVNEILQITNSGGFMMYGADANGDGDITVTDIGVIVDKILGTKTSANSRKMEQEVEPQ